MLFAIVCLSLVKKLYDYAYKIAPLLIREIAFKCNLLIVCDIKISGRVNTFIFLLKIVDFCLKIFA